MDHETRRRRRLRAHVFLGLRWCSVGREEDTGALTQPVMAEVHHQMPRRGFPQWNKEGGINRRQDHGRSATVNERTEFGERANANQNRDTLSFQGVNAERQAVVAQALRQKNHTLRLLGHAVAELEHLVGQASDPDWCRLCMIHSRAANPETVSVAPVSSTP